VNLSTHTVSNFTRWRRTPGGDADSSPSGQRSCAPLPPVKPSASPPGVT